MEETEESLVFIVEFSKSENNVDKQFQIRKITHLKSGEGWQPKLARVSL